VNSSHHNSSHTYYRLLPSTGLFLIVSGLASIFYPAGWVYSNDYMKGMFDGPLNAQSTAVISFAGSLMLSLGFLFYVVRWNTINGRFANAPGCIFAAINCVYIPYKMDGNKFVFRAWHCIATAFVAGAYHMVFKANAPWTSESLKAHEQDQAAKNAKKGK